MDKKYIQISDLVRKEPDYKYEGKLDWETLKKVIVTVEDLTKTLSSDRAFQQKAFHALVEMLQNCYRYRVPDTPVDLFVKSDNGKMYILAKNAVGTEEMKSLNYLIEIINSLNYDELKEIQMEQLKTGKIEPQFKKYNGMMSIRRRTNHKLLTNFSRHEDYGLMFTIIATIEIE
jgi:uncharacterized membrane protein YcaP (DUF421 family)